MADQEVNPDIQPQSGKRPLNEAELETSHVQTPTHETGAKNGSSTVNNTSEPASKRVKIEPLAATPKTEDNNIKTKSIANGSTNGADSETTPKVDSRTKVKGVALVKAEYVVAVPLQFLQY